MQVKTYPEVRQHLVQAMQADRQHMDSSMHAAIEMADKALDACQPSQSKIM